MISCNKTPGKVVDGWESVMFNKVQLVNFILQYLPVWGFSLGNYWKMYGMSVVDDRRVVSE